MLEDLAHRYLTLDDAPITLISIGALLLGALIAALTNRSRSEMLRAPFFVIASGIYLAITLVQYLWLNGGDASIGGYLWTILAATLGANVVGGYFLGHAAMARARDAFGDSRMGALVFAPLLNLWLLFKGSQNPHAPKTHDGRSPLNGGLGVAIGLVFMVTTVLASAHLERLAAEIESGGYYSATEEEAHFAALIAARGLEDALTEMSRGVELPVVVDDGTELTRIDPSPTGLRLTYTVFDDKWTPDETFARTVIAEICADPASRAILGVGGVIVEAYEGLGDGLIVEIAIAAKECGLE